MRCCEQSNMNCLHFFHEKRFGLISKLELIFVSLVVFQILSL